MKKWVIRHAGGKCKACGMCLVDEATAVFHHRNQKEKSYSMAELLRTTKIATILNELAKCDLLCANCHTKIRHVPERPWSPQEIQILELNAGHCDAEALAVLLDRSPYAIKQRLKSKRPAPCRPVWTREELSLLRDHLDEPVRTLRKLLPRFSAEQLRHQTHAIRFARALVNFTRNILA